MKSIERKFNQIHEDNPYWSSLICFNETMNELNYTQRTISKWFKKLVDKDDYEGIDSSILIKQAFQLSNP